MLEHIYEDPTTGLDLRIQYTKDLYGVVEYADIRALDGDYKPCGPNLLEFLSTQYSSLGADAQGNMQVTPSLAVMAEELN